MQSNLDQRVFHYISATDFWVDLTSTVNGWANGLSAALVIEPGDFLYIGAFLPFNHKFLQFNTPSPDPQVPLIEILNAPNEWSPVVDQIDYTNSMQNSGVLQWTTNFDKNWGLVTDSRRDIDAFAGAGPVVYGAFWLRLSFSAQTTIDLNYVGQCFSSDADLYQEYPMLGKATVLNGWKAGKTTWYDQHLMAANYIAKELVQRNILFTNQQILDIATLRSAAVHKAANIIYTGLGVKNYLEEVKQSLSNFTEAMNLSKFQVDTNANARKDRYEVANTTSRATR